MPALVEFAGDLSGVSYGTAAIEDASALASGTGRLGCVGPVSQGTGGALRVLLVGCGAEVRPLLQSQLSNSRWSFCEVGSGAEALEYLRLESCDIVLTAHRLPDLDVNELQELVRAQCPAAQVIGLEATTAYIPTAPRLRELMGARHPAPPTLVLSTAGNQLQSGAGSWRGLLGSSAVMQRVFRLAQMVARRDTTVLIEGESGTGKDLLARAIHGASTREKQPFVVINCAAIPEALLEAELFGYTKGAFTGATQARLGRVHAAHGGTLFLDEIGDLPLSLQSKILRFLEQGEVQRIGGTDTLKVDCRIVAATNVGLKQRVKDKLFREDLYYRLAVVPILLPALRERMEDLDALQASFLDRFAPGVQLHTEARHVLMQHLWPGNVRELRNVMERASLFADARREILPEDVLL